MLNKKIIFQMKKNRLITSLNKGRRLLFKSYNYNQMEAFKEEYDK